MISKLVTELGSEVKLTPPDEVQSFHVQHLPHPHSGFSNSSMVTSELIITRSPVTRTWAANGKMRFIIMFDDNLGPFIHYLHIRTSREVQCRADVRRTDFSLFFSLVLK